MPKMCKCGHSEEYHKWCLWGCDYLVNGEYEKNNHYCTCIEFTPQ